MIRFYFHPTPNPQKISMMLEATGLDYEVVPVDSRKGEQHDPKFRLINPNGKLPAIVDTDGPGGKEVRVFDSNAILLYLAEKTGKFLGKAEDRGEFLSWLMFVATGIGPYSGQAVHFQHVAPEGNDYGKRRYSNEAARHYQVLEDHMEGRDFIVGDELTIVDISAWGWIDKAPFVHKNPDVWDNYPNIKRWFDAVNALPAAVSARNVGKDHTFKTEMDEDAKRAMFPSNYA